MDYGMIDVLAASLITGAIVGGLNVWSTTNTVKKLLEVHVRYINGRIDDLKTSIKEISK